MIDEAANIFYWARVGVVVLVSLLSLVVALRRSRAKASRWDLVFGAIGLVGVAGIAIMAGGSPAGLAVFAGASAAGIAIGVLLVAVRVPAALLTAVATAFAAVMVLFGEPGAQSVGVCVLGLGFGVPLGQGLRRMFAARAEGDAAPMEPSQSDPSATAA